jgi:uracil-DNA glycosylase family 4
LREWLRNERRLGVAHWAVSRIGKQVSVERGRSVSGPRERARSPSRAVTLSLLPDDSGLPPICDRELSEAEARQVLRQLDETYVKACTKCGLHAGRKQTVFGVGCARPPIVFVGEGPGADEDQQGIPFVGRAGQLLTRMIAAMTLTRDQVYICNIVKCRPPGNRTPTEEEGSSCLPYLYRQLAILRPRVIVALGRPATQALLQTNTPIGRLRGDFYDFPPPGLQHLGLPTTPLMPTFHPAYLLRSPGEKAKAWEDLKQVMELLGIPIPTRV